MENRILVDFRIDHYLYQAAQESEWTYGLYRDNGTTTVKIGVFGSRPDRAVIKQKALEKIEATKQKKDNKTKQWTRETLLAAAKKENPRATREELEDYVDDFYL